MPTQDKGPRDAGVANPIIPNPDPSDVTSERIEKEVKHLELRINARVDGIEKAIEVFHNDLTRVPTQFDRAIDCLREVLEARMDGTDKTFGTLKEQVDKRQEVIDAASSHIREVVEEQINGRITERITGRMDLMNEKIKSLSDVTKQQFISINDKFAEKDKAVSVGLSAQKESAAAQQASNADAQNKMETNFTKLLDQGRELLGEFRRNTEIQITDIKSRLDKGEGKTSISDPVVSNGMTQIKTVLEDLAKSRDMGAGRAAGTKDQTALFIAVGAVVISIVFGLIRMPGGLQ